MSNEMCRIDIGRTLFSLLIAETDGEGLRDSMDVSTIVRLGEDLVRSGSLKEEAVSEPSPDCGITSPLTRRWALKIFCVGTEALRKARNGKDFVAQVREMFDLDKR